MKMSSIQRTMREQVSLITYLEADLSRNERKMGGFASWEIFGTGFDILIFCTGFKILDFSTVSRDF